MVIVIVIVFRVVINNSRHEMLHLGVAGELSHVGRENCGPDMLAEIALRSEVRASATGEKLTIQDRELDFVVFRSGDHGINAGLRHRSDLHTASVKILVSAIANTVIDLTCEVGA